MTPELREVLSKRMKEIGDNLNDDDHVIKYTAASLSTKFGKTQRSVGINKPGAVHILRHTLPVELLEAGANIGEVRDWLNHTNLSTTNIYTHISADRLQHVAKLRSKAKEDKTNEP